MPAKRRSLLIEQGATWFDDAMLTQYEGGPALDLTGMDFVMQIRPDVDSDVVLIELSTANGRITTEPLLGIVRRRIEAADTALLTFTAAVYDLYLYTGTERVRTEQGSVTLSLGVTR